MSKGTQVRTVRIDDERWSAANVKAEAENRTVSSVIRELLDAWLADKGRHMS